MPVPLRPYDLPAPRPPVDLLLVADSPSFRADMASVAEGGGGPVPAPPDVPDACLEAFWALVRGALPPGWTLSPCRGNGRVFDLHRTDP